MLALQRLSPMIGYTRGSSHIKEPEPNMSPRQSQEMNDLYQNRSRLLTSLQERGFTDTTVLNALRAVPREEFIASEFRQLAYDDKALPIAAGQTISQPTVVAMMTIALAVKATSRVLEIGTGSGYQAAVLAHIADRVVSIERHPELAARAAATIKRLEINNVEIHEGDGSLGWPASAPYDRILVTAAAPSVPNQLLSQLSLSDGSRLVAPVGDQALQHMVIVERIDGKWIERIVGQVRFVPLRGEAGWSDAEWTEQWKPGT
jgi:protein-L-isoaspartate(D-aspartate) O-methyltransferase